ncbi:nucleotidyltransferase family protein [Neobacillus thermocopriae]|uniref:Nucleotidyltransferase family protein n=1 Tax=Neobacillus thermocopriae TaxID=1215031 RepID=A0A6B3TQ13_9BACI|nr:nucleotidyltransferase family protein [Neobacillus thermocopriae]MED3624647.1 nucleotidyltransferase family protein [Neobacillus thermocopriae]MED3715658.1 nucleotidyltransferase family protein [Neobacillus thermocopriae]NEX78712.1 nucleotidyltransferase family protein [Neobacillus thermocopriae]
MKELNATDYEKQLIEIIKSDKYIMSILKVIENLHLNDAWVCAGLIRNKVWDILHNTVTPLNDIDVIYFDASDTSWEMEKQLENELNVLLPNQPWTVKNQARMHLKSGFNPFSSTYDGVAHFPETPTAIAVRLCNKELEIMAPYGIQDLFEMKVRPTPFYQKDSEFYSIYVERVKKKKWDEIWRSLSIEL